MKISPNNDENAGRAWPISAYINPDYTPKLTEAGAPTDYIECLDMRTTAQRALEWPGLLDTNPGLTTVTEKYYTTHPYAMLAIAWNLNYKNPKVCGVNQNSASIQWYGGSQISVRGLLCTSNALQCNKQRQNDRSRWPCFDRNGKSTYCGGRIIADKHGNENIVEFEGANVLND